MPPPPAPDSPATIREVMGSREYRAVFAASSLSWFGDSVARAAVTALVYQLTDSVAISAATFGISYLPWLGIGSFLAALAERYPYRRVMIICDVARLVLMGLVVLPGLPTIALMALLLATALLSPPFEAARSAMLPLILKGDRYVVGLSINNTVRQLTIIAGYAVGAVASGADARAALLFNAATFGVSALLIRFGIRERPPALAADQRTNLRRETADGFRIIFGSPLLRSIAIIVFLCVFFSILPEGLAAGWAAQLTDSKADRGIYQAVIMAASPVGFVIGSVVIGRLTAPAVRIRLIRPFAVLSPLVLVPALLDPGVYTIAVMNAAVGFLVAGLVPAANGLFVQALLTSFRARAFGVMQSGMQISQGLAILSSGLLADRFQVSTVVGVWTMAGVLIMALTIRTWPSEAAIAAEIESVRIRNQRGAPEAAGRP